MVTPSENGWRCPEKLQPFGLRMAVFEHFFVYKGLFSEVIPAQTGIRKLVGLDAANNIGFLWV